MKKSAALASAKWFVQDPYFENIVDLCRLKPTNDWHVWNDEAGNILRLTKDKKIRIFATSKPEITTDIYRYAKPSNISAYSYWAMLSVDEQNNGQLWFVGYDERLRFMLYTNNKYYSQLPLSAVGRQGIKTLRKIATLAGTSVMDAGKTVTVATLWPPDLPIHEKIDPIVKGLQI